MDRKGKQAVWKENGRDGNNSSCLSFKIKAGFRKGTRISNISIAFLWHVSLRILILLSVNVCGVRCSHYGPSNKTQVWAKKKSTFAVELCLTKHSNITLSSRISMHASKVHLPSLFKHSSRCGMVSMATMCIIQHGPCDFSFRCSWVTAPRKICYTTLMAMNCD